MIVRTEGEQPAPKQSVRDEVERLVHQLARARPGLREVDRFGREVDSPGRIDDLDPDPVAGGEAGPWRRTISLNAADSTRGSSGPVSRAASEML
jgi:hypothetical protein